MSVGHVDDQMQAITDPPNPEIDQCKRKCGISARQTFRVGCGIIIESSYISVGEKKFVWIECHNQSIKGPPIDAFVNLAMRNMQSRKQLHRQPCRK